MKFINHQFWGLVCGAGSPFRVLSEMLKASINYGDKPFIVSALLTQVKHILKKY